MATFRIEDRGRMFTRMVALASVLILGAVGVLQFDVAVHRLKGEYGVDAIVEPVQVATAVSVATNGIVVAEGDSYKALDLRIVTDYEVPSDDRSRRARAEPNRSAADSDDGDRARADGPDVGSRVDANGIPLPLEEDL